MLPTYTIHKYIVIYRQTVSVYHNSSVWLETRDAPSRETRLTLRQADDIPLAKPATQRQIGN